MRAPGSQSLRNRSQSRCPAGPEITAFNPASSASGDAPSPAPAAVGACAAATPIHAATRTTRTCESGFMRPWYPTRGSRAVSRGQPTGSSPATPESGEIPVCRYHITQLPSLTPSIFHHTIITIPRSSIAAWRVILSASDLGVTHAPFPTCPEIHRPAPAPAHLGAHSPSRGPAPLRSQRRPAPPARHHPLPALGHLHLRPLHPGRHPPAYLLFLVPKPRVPPLACHRLVGPPAHGRLRPAQHRPLQRHLQVLLLEGPLRSHLRSQRPGLPPEMAASRRRRRQFPLRPRS